MSKYFLPADMLLPKSCQMEKWAVIACDQFTSDAAYWQRVHENADNNLSTLHMILPEAELAQSDEHTIDRINAYMRSCLDSDVLETYPDAYVYVERTMQNGAVRQGIVGVVDLEAYDFDPSKHPMISATEKTVLERIPPRVAVRKDALMEFSHVLMLCEDDQFRLIEPVGKMKDSLPKIYDFDLMEGGGHIAGWLLQGKAAEPFRAALRQYEESNVYLVGDGNHSLVTAKRCYENLKQTLPEAEYSTHPARYAMVEMENIHSGAILFEAIHRIITDTQPQQLLHDLSEICDTQGPTVKWYAGGESGELHLKVTGADLPVGVLQQFLDGWLSAHPGSIDYVHEMETVRDISARENAIGFEIPELEKHMLFSYVKTGKTLPRKAFSMGQGCEKRYYLEGRKIK